jgi:hypothetical protein
MKNIPLLIFDLLCFPITLVRMILIYFYGSKYGVDSLYFLDVILHADNKYFNQLSGIPTVDTTKEDIRISINQSSRLEKIQRTIQEEQTTFIKQPDKLEKIEENLKENNKKSVKFLDPKTDILVEDSKNHLSDDLDNLFVRKTSSDRLTNRLNEELKYKLSFMSFEGDVRSISDGSDK